MLGSGAVLGAPSLPKFTSRRPSDDRPESATPPQGRRAAAPAESRKSLRTPASLKSSPPRPEPVVVRSPRQTLVGVAGRAASVVPDRPAPAFHRILKAAVAVRSEKITHLCLEPHPELRIELSFRGGAVHGVVHAATDGARDRIADHLDQLRTMLEEKGIQVGEFRVVVDGASEEVPLSRSVRVHLVDLLA